MKNLFLLVIALFAVKCAVAQDVYVNGYYKSNGTYVDGYYRTHGNSTINDNYSTVGNVNPYTGKAGTVLKQYYSTPTTYSLPTYTPPPVNSPYYEAKAIANFTNPVREVPAIITPVESKVVRTVRGGKYFSNINGKKNYIKQPVK